MDTCAFLIRSGCVSVNGVVILDAKTRIDAEDVISVNGSDIETFTERDSLPRNRRDLETEDREITKDYTKGIDEGFYSGKRTGYGK